MKNLLRSLSVAAFVLGCLLAAHALGVWSGQVEPILGMGFLGELLVGVLLEVIAFPLWNLSVSARVAE